MTSILNLRDFQSVFLIIMGALIITLFLELIVCRIFGYRDKKSMKVVALINIMTNPLLNVLLFFIMFKLQGGFGFIEFLATLVLLEGIVILVEWKLLVYSLKKESAGMLRLSLFMNLSSLIIGPIVVIVLGALFVFMIRMVHSIF